MQSNYRGGGGHLDVAVAGSIDRASASFFLRQTRRSRALFAAPASPWNDPRQCGYLRDEICTLSYQIICGSPSRVWDMIDIDWDSRRSHEIIWDTISYILIAECADLIAEISTLPGIIPRRCWGCKRRLTAHLIFWLNLTKPTCTQYIGFQTAHHL